MGKYRIKQRYIDDFLVLLMFCISGNPAFVSTAPLGKFVYGLMLLVILLVSGFKIKREALKQSANWIILLAVIFGCQFLLLGQITVLGSLNLIVKLLCAILLASYMGRRLPDTAIRVMSGICLVSLVFYLINLTGVRFESPLDIDMKSKSLIIYTQTWDDPHKDIIFRNSGMFWEPGAFAGYIIATWLLFVDQPQALWKKHKVSFLIMFLSLLTTTSTTGYITFVILLLYFLFQGNRKGYGKWIAYGVATIVLLGAIFAFNRIDFLGQKIQREILASENLTDSDVNDSRIGSFIFDLQYITSHPVFGNGLSDQTRYRFHLGLYDKESLDGLGNGFSGCIASMGLLFMLAYLMAIGFNRTLRAWWMVVLMVILLLQGEYYLNYPWFMMFPFLNFGSVRESPARKQKIRFVWNKTQENESQS
jgi:hypothetical protein